MKAVKITCPELIEQEQIPQGLYGKTELGLVVMYFNTLVLLDESNKIYVAEKTYRLLRYVSQSQWDDENKCGIYAALVVMWCKCSSDHVDTKDKFYHLENAVSLLQKCSETYCIIALYQHLINIRRELGLGTEEEEECRSVFEELFEEFQVPYRDIFYQTYDDVIMIQIINSYIKRARKYENKSQEAVSDGICTVESYSRIENGRHINTGHYKAIARKLKIEERYYYDLIKTSKARAVSVRKEFNCAFNCEQYELCSSKLQELQGLLENDLSENEQFFLYQSARLKYAIKEYTIQQYSDALDLALKCTCGSDKLSSPNHTFTQIEIKIINSLAVVQMKLRNVQEAIALLCNLIQCVESDCYCRDFNFIALKLAKLNLGTFLTSVQRMKEARHILYDTVRESLLRNDCFHVDYLLAEYAYSFDGEDAEPERQFFKYAKMISKFLNHMEYYNVIVELTPQT